MFYAHFVLSKKGPLARIWLAAHWDKKLTKAHVFETNIEKSVEGILQPKVKLALRTSGHLLLGVVRIYSRKAKYLLADCNEAFVKIKMAFRPGMVDLPEESREAAVNAITLPEVFHDFTNDLNDLNDVDIQAQFALNQSRAEEITMREDFGNLQMHNQFEADDNFSGNVGLEGAEASELLRDENELDRLDDNLDLLGADFGTVRHTRSKGIPALEASTALELPPTPAAPHSVLAPPSHSGMDDDGFGGGMGSDIMSGGLFEGGIFDDVPMDVAHPPEPLDDALLGPRPSTSVDQLHHDLHHHQQQQEPMQDREPDATEPQQQQLQQPPSPAGAAADSDDEDDAYMDNFGADGPPSVGESSRSNSPAPSVAGPTHVGPETDMGPPPPPMQRQTRSSAAAAVVAMAAVTAVETSAVAEQTTLIQNEDESFALAPVDASALKGWPRTRRKRKLIVDEVKNISGEEMKSQLADTSDIVTTLDLAPPTKRLMHWKETGGVERLFTLSGRNIPGKPLFDIYSRHLQSKPLDNDELPDGAPEDAIQLPPSEEEAERERRLSRNEEEEEGREEDKENQEENPEVRRSGRGRGRKRKTMEESELERQAMEEQFQQLHQTAIAEATRLSTRSAAQQSLMADEEHEQMQMRPEEMSNVQPPEPAIPAFEEPSTDLLPPPPPASTTLPNQPEMANMGWDGPPLDIQHPMEGANSPFSVRGAYPMMTPGHDFDFPPSVGAPSMAAPGDVGEDPEDQQATDETYEEYEERVLNKRAVQMHRLFKVKFDELAEDTAATENERRLEFHAMLSRNNNRKQVSQKFYTLLVLKKAKAIELDQDESFGPILVYKGPDFNTCKL